MDMDSVPRRTGAGPVTIGGIVFNNNSYDETADVLYVNVGKPGDAVDWIGTAEGDGTSHGPDGNLIGMTILNAKRRLERDGRIEFTLPEHKVVVTDLGDVFDHPYKYVPDEVKIPGRVALGRFEFDDIVYDRKGDILFLRSGDMSRVASEGSSEESYYLRFDAAGELIAVTIAEARYWLERNGKIVVTLPDGPLELSDLGTALAAA
jgi:uncharacterized protein YuzE